MLTNVNATSNQEGNFDTNKSIVLDSIKAITNTNIKALVASSGLSTQYAIAMGLIHDAVENHPGKAIKIVVPPNCYGGTNDQARLAAKKGLVGVRWGQAESEFHQVSFPP